MSYAVCPNCGQKALTVATRCPRCGLAFEAQFLGHVDPPSKHRGVRRALLVVAAVLALLAVNAVAVRFKVPVADTSQDTRPVPAVVVARPVPAPAESSLAPDTVLETGQAAADRAVTAPLTQPESSRVVAPPATPSPALPSAAPAAVPGAEKRRYANTWINVRAEPRNSAPVLRILRPGDAVRVDSLAHGWYRVLSNGAPEGFVDFRFLDSLPAPGTP